MNDDRPVKRRRTSSDGRRFPDKDIAPANILDEAEEEKRKKRLARFGTLVKPKINEVGNGTKELTSKEDKNVQNKVLDKKDRSMSREMNESTGESKPTQSSREDKASRDKESGLLDPVSVDDKARSSSPTKNHMEPEESGVGLLVPVEAASSYEDEREEDAVEKRRKDRLARFGTTKDPRIEQPFKPKNSVEKGDNMRPLWRDGRARSRDQESSTPDKEEGEQDTSA